MDTPASPGAPCERERGKRERDRGPEWALDKGGGKERSWQVGKGIGVGWGAQPGARKSEGARRGVGVEGGGEPEETQGQREHPGGSEKGSGRPEAEGGEVSGSMRCGTEDRGG